METIQKNDIKCPICGHSDFIFEREKPIIVCGDKEYICINGIKIPLTMNECKYFCIKCNKDF